MNESKQERVLNRIKSTEIQKQEWSVIILILNITYNITESVLLIENMSHIYRNVCYQIYSLNEKSDETLCESISDEKNDDEQHILCKLMRIQQWKHDKDLFANAL